MATTPGSPARTRSGRQRWVWSSASTSSPTTQSFRPGGNVNRGFDLDEIDVGRERQPRSAGQPGDGSSARLQAVRVVSVPVRHADRRQLLRRERHAAHDLRQHHQRHRDLRRRAWRHGPDTDLLNHRRAAVAGVQPAWPQPPAVRAQRAERLQREDRPASVQLSEPSSVHRPISISAERISRAGTTTTR